MFVLYALTCGNDPFEGEMFGPFDTEEATTEFAQSFYEDEIGEGELIWRRNSAGGPLLGCDSHEIGHYIVQRLTRNRG